MSREISFILSNGEEAKYEATIGFYPDPDAPYAAAEPGEIFLFGAKDGSDLAALCADGSVLVSIALQYGCPIEVLAEAIGRAPIEVDGPAVRPVSILGAALDAILEAKREKDAADAA